MKVIDDVYLDILKKDNKDLIKKINKNISIIENIKDKLIEADVKLEDFPWYKNIFEIYLPEAREFHNNIEKNLLTNKDIQHKNEIWLRKDMKAFMSDVEKSCKWFIKTIYKNTTKYGDTFKSANIHIISPFMDYPPKPRPNVIEIMEYEKNTASKIFRTLELWRELYNFNKHEYKEPESFVHLKGDTLTVGDTDIIGFVALQMQNISYFASVIYRIIVLDKYELRDNPNHFYSSGDGNFFWGVKILEH